MEKSLKGNVISAQNASLGWLKVTEHVLSCGGKCFNVMVQIKKPNQIDSEIHTSFRKLCEEYEVPSPTTSANTIFPQSIYKKCHRNRKKLFKRYIRIYPRHKKRRWGTYFGRMIEWPFTKDGKPINQLEKVIQTINGRSNVFSSAYTIQICSPERNFGQPRGGPCLNLIVLQPEKTTNCLNMLAIYRNHDLIEKAYGNYLGLGYLLKFLCDQTSFSLGALTCVSSHAYINSAIPRDKIRTLLRTKTFSESH